jgi:nicotinic acid mononucleotide adenylyltransferase
MVQWKVSPLLFSSEKQQLSLFLCFLKSSFYTVILLLIILCDCVRAYQLLPKVSHHICCVTETHSQTNCWILHCRSQRKSFLLFATNSCDCLLLNQRQLCIRSRRCASGALSCSTADCLPSVNFDDNMINYCSLECLQRRVKLLVQHFQEQPNCSPKLSIVTAGGGGHLLSTLAATPGASAILLEGTTPYSRQAFQDFIQREMTFNFGQPFKYCSAEAARALSDAACRRALFLLSGELDGSSPATDKNWTNILRGAVGVAATSVLQSSTVIGQNADGSPIVSSRRSVESFGSRAFCAVQTSNGLQVQLFAQLCREQSSDTDSSSQSIVRSRFVEDVFVSHCLLTCFQISRVNDFESVINLIGIASNVDLSHHFEENEIVIQWTSAGGDDFTVRIPSSYAKSLENSISLDVTLRIGAKRILEGSDEVVMILLPNGCNNTLEVLHTTQLPLNSLIVPGSFNPPHVGHILLAKAAARAMNYCSSIWFELSIKNADKPALDVETIVDRIKYFFEFRDEMPRDICWGILLSNAPLFKQKVALFAPLQLNNKNAILHFSIGTDTLVRLVDPKYYNNSADEMYQSLRKMSCQFFVGGRLDQGGVAESIFISGDQVVYNLPLDLRNKFTILPNFRIDLSSTEIRSKMATYMNTEQRNV